MIVDKKSSPIVQRRLATRFWTAALLCAAAISACESHPAGTQQALFAASPDARAINALGETVTLRQFSEKYVWIDYAAEWCSACAPQSRVIRSLAKMEPADIVFLTVMTSEPDGYGHPATQSTASRWAKRLDLDPARVVGTDATAMTLPQHALYSPAGIELFRYVGGMSAADIRKTLAEKKQAQ